MCILHSPLQRSYLNIDIEPPLSNGFKLLVATEIHASTMVKRQLLCVCTFHHHGRWNVQYCSYSDGWKGWECQLVHKIFIRFVFLLPSCSGLMCNWVQILDLVSFADSIADSDSKNIY